MTSSPSASLSADVPSGLPPTSEDKDRKQRNKMEGTWVPERQQPTCPDLELSLQKGVSLSRLTLRSGVSFRAGRTTLPNAALKKSLHTLTALWGGCVYTIYKH